MNTQDVTKVPTVKDLHVSSKNKFSHFLRVSKTDVIFIEVIPFLTPSQVSGGFSSSWFSQLHLQELVALLRSHIVKHLQNFKDENDKSSAAIKGNSPNFILSGDHLRAACNFKRNLETNYYLIPRKKRIAINSSDTDEKFQEVTLLQKKLLIYVCPKSSSSMLQLSQLLTSDKENFQEETEDISKYFQPVSSK